MAFWRIMRRYRNSTDIPLLFEIPPNFLLFDFSPPLKKTNFIFYFQEDGTSFSTYNLNKFLKIYNILNRGKNLLDSLVDC